VSPLLSASAESVDLLTGRDLANLRRAIGHSRQWGNEGMGLADGRNDC